MVEQAIEVKGEPGTPPVTPQVEPSGEEKGEDVNILRSKLEESEKRRAGLDRERTRLQQDNERLLAAVGSGNVSQIVLDRLDAIELAQAETMDAQGVTGEEETPLSHKERLLRKRVEAQNAQKIARDLAWESQISMAWGDVVDMAGEKQAPVESITQDPQFIGLWQRGDLRGAKKRASEIAAVKAPSTLTPKSSGLGEEAGETEEQRINRLAEERYRQTLRERGLLQNELGGGSGGTPRTLAEASKLYAEGSINNQQYREYRNKLQ